jgi:site-specific recombinase XerD
MLPPTSLPNDLTRDKLGMGGQDCFAATLKRGETVLVTQFDRPFSDKALGMRMIGWTAVAGIEKGATIHGLRKTVCKLLAESGATTRELMQILGHEDIKHAELYSKAAEQRRLAQTGYTKLQGNRLSVIKGGKADG